MFLTGGTLGKERGGRAEGAVDMKDLREAGVHRVG